MKSTNPDALTYEKSGVLYDLIDPVKVSAQQAAASTAVQLAGHGFSEVASSRGESAYVVDVGPSSSPQSFQLFSTAGDCQKSF